MKLGRTASHRKATLRNLATALIEHHKIRTTHTKAKAAQRYIERLISYGKKDTVHSRRLAFKFLQSRTLVKKLFDEIATNFEDRNGGYTRIIKLGQRRGDAAEMALLQLVGFDETFIDDGPSKKKSAPKKKKSKKAAAAKAAAPAVAAKASEKAADAAEEAADAAEEAVEEATEKAAKPKKATKKTSKKAEESTETADDKPADAEAPAAEEKPKKAKKPAADDKKGDDDKKDDEKK